MKNQFCLFIFVWLFLLFFNGCSEPVSSEQEMADPYIDKNLETLYVSKILNLNSLNLIEIQNPDYFTAIFSKAVANNQVVSFSGMKLLLSTSKGITLVSGLKLNLEGCEIDVNSSINNDGQVFFGQNISDLTLTGGIINGNRQSFPASVNIAGICLIGKSEKISITKTIFRQLSSNGIRIHGVSSNERAKNISVKGVQITECCNIYNDYSEPNPGPVPGTLRTDQGGINFYFVEDFLIENSILELSKSDGTHFYKSIRGTIKNSVIRNNKMGGYFLEGCSFVFGLSNLIQGNGSRGVTIERGSDNCSLTDNIIEKSGRDGIWIDDSQKILVKSNSISLNGRKNDVDRTYNIKITDTAWPIDSSNPKVTNIVIYSNSFNADLQQIHSIKISSSSYLVSVFNNLMQGVVRSIRPDCYSSGVGKVSITGNPGWKTESSGSFPLSLLSNSKQYFIKNNLDFYDPSDYYLRQNVQLILETSISGTKYQSRKFKLSSTFEGVTVSLATNETISDNSVMVNWNLSYKLK